MTTDSDPDTQAAHAVPPPSPSNRSTRALIGILLAGLAGMIIFLFVNISKDGKIRPGPTKAHAGCTRGAYGSSSGRSCRASSSSITGMSSFTG